MSITSQEGCNLHSKLHLIYCSLQSLITTNGKLQSLQCIVGMKHHFAVT